jgi:hypothetical protein
MLIKRSRDYWRAIRYLKDTDPSGFVEFLLVSIGALMAAIALVTGYIWPFGFASLLFGIGFAGCLMARELVAPTPRGPIYRLVALLVLLFCLAFLVYFWECEL